MKKHLYISNLTKSSGQFTIPNATVVKTIRGVLEAYCGGMDTEEITFEIISALSGISEEIPSPKATSKDSQFLSPDIKEDLRKVLIELNNRGENFTLEDRYDFLRKHGVRKNTHASSFVGHVNSVIKKEGLSIEIYRDFYQRATKEMMEIVESVLSSGRPVSEIIPALLERYPNKTRANLAYLVHREFPKISEGLLLGETTEVEVEA